MTPYEETAYLTLGSVSIPWYLLTLIAGLAVFYLLIEYANRKHGYDRIVSVELLFFNLFGGMIFGRLLWVLENLSNYLKYTPYIFNILDGGFEAIGVLSGVAISTWIYTREHEMSWLREMDIMAPALLLCFSIARIGRALKYPTVWYVIGMGVIGSLVLWFMRTHYHEGRQRGEITFLSFALLGLITLVSKVFSLDPHASNTLVTCILFELVSALIYFLVHRLKKKKPVILFDLDGTLMDSRRMVLLCFVYLFRKYGKLKDFTPEKQRAVFGPPLQESMKELFPDQDPEKLTKEYRKYQASFSWSQDVSMFPHSAEVLDSLKEQGYTMGIVSSRITESAESWLRQLKAEEYFRIVVGRDKVKKAKPDPEGILYACTRLHEGHDDCIYIGDNADDVMAARNCGVYAIGFDSSPDKREELEAAKPNAIIKDLTELEEILERDHSWTYERI